jgi:hypothetical protein
MKAILICPSDRAAVRFLAETCPLSNLPVFGKPLLVSWLEHLSARGTTDVRVVTSDRPEQVQAMAGDGSRWGLRIEVLSETRELTPEEARAQYGANAAGQSEGGSEDVVVIDHFPGLPEYPLFKSYANWFNALRALISRTPQVRRAEAKEVKPGVWVDSRARIAPSAVLRAPCWIGANAVVGADTIIGPMAVLEDRVMVEPSVEISNSAVAPETFVGELTEVKNSLANGSLLINWRTNSCIRVPDAFLLCSLGKRTHAVKSRNLVGQIAALLIMVLTLPLALIPILWAKLRGQPALRSLVAVRPQLSNHPDATETLVYYELAKAWGWLRYWPQMWNIAKSDFALVGNRPLSPSEVAGLSTDFERLWLATPIGIISMAAAEGAIDTFGYETRAWAGLYALQANWRLDISIIARALVATTKKSFTALF